MCINVYVFPELEKALGLKLHDALNVESESSKRKVRVTKPLVHHMHKEDKYRID